ncbi:MAG TPA: hypothetical protein VGL71_11150 [Urbifossiella sp.]|jgi:hypothetical protein
MRTWLAALGATLAIATGAFAQQSGPGFGSNMPGQIVSTGYGLKAAGIRLPSAAPQAGRSVGSPLAKPYDPSRPLDVFKGTNLSANDVVAPVSGFPGLSQQPNLLDRINSKIDSVTSFFKPSTPALTTRMITPGIYRRNRERAQERMWMRD